TASTADRSCLEKADLIICNNTSMESDHLILAVQVIQAAKQGVKLIVSNSTLDSTDQHLATLALDPMRGRAAVLWDGVIQSLLDEDYFPEDKVRQIPGGETFLEKRNQTIKNVSELTGVEAEHIRQAADIIRQAKNIVVVHSPDRTQDQAPADMQILANLIILSRGLQKQANLLLPRINSNSAGLEITGAVPAFGPGRVVINGDLAGVTSQTELQILLAESKIKAAIIIGEDPMAWTKSGSWFSNIEFLAVMDWTETETTQYADVVLPGSTFLETAGTRCNFEGKVVSYRQAVAPRAGVSSRDILRQLSQGFGVKTTPNTTKEIQAIVQTQQGDLSRYYWNTSSANRPGKINHLIAVKTPVQSGSIAPPFTHSEKYKKQIKDVGHQIF
ncbi:MAG: molybdopterin-dependent oxidoreductase, partial [Planctomycetes bacterium]|nr:molybdopterin-dependent oxidoreductase [Planctomycetota bacterium]